MGGGVGGTIVCGRIEGNQPNPILEGGWNLGPGRGREQYFEGNMKVRLGQLR